MNPEYLSLSSEITELQALLSNLPEDHLLERMSLESRLESVKTELAALPQDVAPKARLTGGAPAAVVSRQISVPGPPTVAG